MSHSAARIFDHEYRRDPASSLLTARAIGREESSWPDFLGDRLTVQLSERPGTCSGWVLVADQYLQRGSVLAEDQYLKRLST